MSGLDEPKPHHYRGMLRIAWENRDQLPFAWRILSRGVCDGCALGASGLSDWTIPGTHLCMVRLEQLRINTAPALDVRQLTDISSLERLTSPELRELGRIPHPLLRRRGETGFLVATWDEALERIATGLVATDPQRGAFYLTSRGLTNEVYYAAQKAARFYGSPHIDHSARLAHAASTSALDAALGYGASTCSYVDWLNADLIVLFGSDVEDSQPVTTKYLQHARQHGAQIAVMNADREPRPARHWVATVPSSARSGAQRADHWFDVHAGGDSAFLVGVLRALVEIGGVDEAFVRERTGGFEAACAAACAADWPALERDSGASRDDMRVFAQLLVERPNAVFAWSSELTPHAGGANTIKALVNVGLARGLAGRPHRGLMPIGRHSGVQGAAEVGCVPVVDERTAARWSEVWEFPVAPRRGWTAPEMIERAAAGDVDLLWIVGGNFLETRPDVEQSRRALRRPLLRIHHALVLSTSMLAESDGDVLILPAATRYESEGGGTETSTERRIIFSPEIPGRRVGIARPEWWAFGEAMARAWPNRANYVRFDSAAAIRSEIARAIPLYAGIETLAKQGDQVQWGGRNLYSDGQFATPDGKAHFSVISRI
jgi:molybdopterin-dependent oxidoreductase alpha subunit